MRRPWRRCASCRGVCHWVEGWWVCDDCGDACNTATLYPDDPVWDPGSTAQSRAKRLCMKCAPLLTVSQPYNVDDAVRTLKDRIEALESKVVRLDDMLSEYKRKGEPTA